MRVAPVLCVLLLILAACGDDGPSCEERGGRVHAETRTVVVPIVTGKSVTVVPMVQVFRTCVLTDEVRP
jgi:hypothetical protein